MVWRAGGLGNIVQRRCRRKWHSTGWVGMRGQSGFDKWIWTIVSRVNARRPRLASQAEICWRGEETVRGWKVNRYEAKLAWLSLSPVTRPERRRPIFKWLRCRAGVNHPGKASKLGMDIMDIVSGRRAHRIGHRLGWLGWAGLAGLGSVGWQWQAGWVGWAGGPAGLLLQSRSRSAWRTSSNVG